MIFVCGCNKENNDIKIVYEQFGPYEDQTFMHYVIYRDEEYRYLYQPQKKEAVEYKNNVYTFDEALKLGIVTIEDLENAGVVFFKEERGKIFEVECKSDDMYKYYEDLMYDYYVKIDCLYVIKNNQTYDLKYALDNNIIRLDEIELQGYLYKKESKNID